MSSAAIILSNKQKKICRHAGFHPRNTEHKTLTLLGEERFLVERPHHGRPQVQGSQVTQVTVAAMGLLMVQLRLDAEWTLTSSHTPLEVLSSSPFILTFVEPQLPRGVFHTLPLLNTHTHTHTHTYTHT